MHSRDEHFQPESVEEQLRQLVQTAPRPADNAAPDARMAQDLRATYTDYTRSGERVWMRLAEHLKEQDTAPGDLKLLPNKHIQTERSQHMQVEQFTTQPAPRGSRPRKPRRIFALVASLLAVTLLAGSIWALTAVRQLSDKTAAAPQTSTTRTAHTPAATSTGPAYTGPCPAFNDNPAFLKLCQNHQLQLIDQGYTFKNAPGKPFLKVEAGYADSNIILIWVHAEGPISPQTFFGLRGTLTSAQLSPNNLTFTSGDGGGKGNGLLDELDTYEPSSIASGTQQLRLSLKEDISLLSSGHFQKFTTSFSFSLTVHSSQTIHLNKTVVANGIPVTLDSVTIGATGVKAVFSCT